MVTTLIDELRQTQPKDVVSLIQLVVDLVPRLAFKVPSSERFYPSLLSFVLFHVHRFCLGLFHRSRRRICFSGIRRNIQHVQHSESGGSSEVRKRREGLLGHRVRGCPRITEADLRFGMNARRSTKYCLLGHLYGCGRTNFPACPWTDAHLSKRVGLLSCRLRLILEQSRKPPWDPDCQRITWKIRQSFQSVSTCRTRPVSFSVAIVNDREGNAITVDHEIGITATISRCTAKGR